MNTPWGKTDSTTRIAKGISWVNTPSHGGLAVTATVAVKTLTNRAVTIALRAIHGTELVNLPRTSHVFFEEDCLYAVAFFEHPEWKRMLEQAELDGLHTAGGPYDEMRNKLNASIAKSDAAIKAEMESVVRRWYPEYFTQGE